MTTVVAITIQSLMVRPLPGIVCRDANPSYEAPPIGPWSKRVPPESKPASRRRGRRLDVG
jgi:hypothetical protein